MDLRSWRTWLRPGMLIKRWILLILISVVAIGLAIAMGLTWAYRNYYPALDETSPFVRAVTLQPIPHPWREILMLSVGGAILAYALWKLSHSVISPLMALTSGSQRLSEIVAEHRFGPVRPTVRVVAIGGGTGLSNLLRGLKHHDIDITAVVTVADDGGSTGRIRREYDMPAPGDIRNCIAALSDAESLVTQLFQYRFDKEGSELAGHSFGNLFIAALTQTTGSFEQAVIESSRVLNIHGRVLPSTLENVQLCADLADGTTVRGESTIGRNKPQIERIYLDPEHPDAYTPVLEAIVSADLIVLGPGSLYTSVIPNLLVAGVVDAIRWSRGPAVYVCNVATQHGETDNLSARDHIRIISEQLGPGVLDYAIVNSNLASVNAIRPELQVEAIIAQGLDAVEDGVVIIQSDVLSEKNPLRHDPDKLAALLVDLARTPTSTIEASTPVQPDLAAVAQAN